MPGADATSPITIRTTFGSGEPSSLTLREPQVAQARAQLSASRAALERVRLDLERTTIRAPFSGILRRKLVDLREDIEGLIAQ